MKTTTIHPLHAHDCDLVRRSIEGDSEATHRLVEMIAPLIYRQVTRTCRSRSDYADLTAHINAVVLAAIPKFKPEAGKRWSTYALFWVQNAAMEWAHRSRSEASHAAIPRWVVGDLGILLKRARTEGRRPTDANLRSICERLGWKPSRAVRAIEAKRCLERRRVVEGRDERPILASIGDGRNPDPLTELIRREQLAIAMELVESLPSRDAEIVKRRFGVGYEPHTLEQLSKLFGITRSRVEQVERRSLHRLQTMGRRRYQEGGAA
jgi:RNA polymerase sigma factor (sigma-70 family)